MVITYILHIYLAITTLNASLTTFFPIFATLLKRAVWYRQQLLFRFFFYHLNRSKMLSFHRGLQFWEEEKVSGGRGQWIRWLRHDYGCVFGQKLIHKHWSVSCCVIMVQNPWLIFLQFSVFLTHNFSSSIPFFIDRTTLWQKFMMHHAIAIEENSKQNFHILSNLTCFFRSRLFLGRFHWDVTAIHSWFVTSYGLFF